MGNGKLKQISGNQWDQCYQWYGLLSIEVHHCDVNWFELGWINDFVVVQIADSCVGDVVELAFRDCAGGAAADEGLIFNSAAQRHSADEALITAHNILLDVLDLQKEHFGLEKLGDLLQICFEDFTVVWKKDKPASG